MNIIIISIVACLGYIFGYSSKTIESYQLGYDDGYSDGNNGIFSHKS